MEQEKEHQLTFMTLAYPGSTALAALTMAKSIRAFGGSLKDCPIWLLVPAELNEFAKPTRQSFQDLKIEITPFENPPDFSNFPFAPKISAAAHAERRAQGKTGLLAWLDCDNIILRELDEFLLAAGKSLGYRPVHHKLIGLAWDEPPDAFWKLVYHACEVPENLKFQMVTHTGQKIRPYFNAGTFVIRPELGMMEKWRVTFTRLYQRPEFQAFSQTDDLYAIFMHQAILTGVILNALKPDEMQEFSPKINYPLHLHAEIPPNLRPDHINDLTSLRYEGIFRTPDWRQQLPIQEPLRSWLEQQPIVKNTSPDAS